MLSDMRHFGRSIDSWIVFRLTHIGIDFHPQRSSIGRAQINCQFNGDSIDI